jgi:aminopeptidase N
MKTQLFLFGALFLFLTVQGQNVQNNSIHLNEKRAFSNKMNYKALNDHSNYDITYHRIYWEVNPSELYIKGSITSYFKTLTDGFSVVNFDLIDPLKTDSVIYHKKKLSFSHANDLLKINLPSALSKETLDSVTVYYQGMPVSASGFGSFEATFHNNVPILWTLSEPYGAKEWWPCKQTLTDKIDSIDIYVKTPSGNKVGSNGKLMYEKTTGNSTITYWKHRYPIATYLVAIAVTNYVSFSDYATVNEQNDQVEILNYVYPESLDWAQPMAKYTVDAIELYSSLFIPYPFYKEKYGHAQFGWGGGMEHQTMSFMGGFSQDLIAHELAHQWFGDYITCSNWHDIWVNEGFAVFCESLCQEHLHPENFLSWKIGRMEYVLDNTASGSVYVEDTTNINRIFNYPLTYQKGGLIIHQLRNQIGDDAFFRGIKNLLTNKNTMAGFVSANDVKEYLQIAADTNLTNYFNDWYYGEGYPEYTFEWTQDMDNTLSIKVNQSTTHSSVSFFSMRIPLLLNGADNETLVRFHNIQNNQLFNYNPGFKVTSIVFDPEYTIIAPHPASFVLGISNEEAEKSISLIPNPGNELLTIKSGKNASFASIAIVDASGKNMLLEKQFHSTNQTEINISQIPVGIYYVRIETNQGVVIKKLVISR